MAKGTVLEIEIRSEERGLAILAEDSRGFSIPSFSKVVSIRNQ
jgi:hypothetical protein